MTSDTCQCPLSAPAPPASTWSLIASSYVYTIMCLYCTNPQTLQLSWIWYPQLPSSFPSALLSSEVLQPPINLENNNSVRTVVQCTVYSVHVYRQCTVCCTAASCTTLQASVSEQPSAGQHGAERGPRPGVARHVCRHLDSPRSEPVI